MTTTAISWDLFSWIVIGGILVKVIAEIIKKKNEKVSTKTETSTKQKEMKDTVVTITKEERKSIMFQIILALGVASIIVGGILGFIAYDYWKFALHGIQGEATVIKRDVHQSSGRHRRKTYTYTLQSSVNGKDVVDTTGTGRDGSYVVGTIVDVYTVSSEGKTDIAIKEVIDNSPIQGVIPLGIGGVFWIFGLLKWKQVRTGKMKSGELPKKFQKERRRAMK